MFGIGMPELLVILVIALIVIGPSKLPDIAKALGKGMLEFRKATQEIKNNLNIDKDISAVKEDLADSISGLQGAAMTQAEGAVPDAGPAPEKGKEQTPPKPSEAQGPPRYASYDAMLEDYETRKAAPDKERPEVVPAPDKEDRKQG